jgi:hypothetical protein
MSVEMTDVSVAEEKTIVPSELKNPPPDWTENDQFALNLFMHWLPIRKQNRDPSAVVAIPHVMRHELKHPPAEWTTEDQATLDDSVDAKCYPIFG